ncbi:hypothetical protein NC652_012571 [Populus alba x Populus x berolinensis]|nr:hypothetical protein NC652_012560 [Populus alba x Populus x berolinensis]KAJ6928497.1 hypothetical protein NC652_012571 [Populus alba x Populus x berolinensis]
MMGLPGQVTMSFFRFLLLLCTKRSCDFAGSVDRVALQMVQELKPQFVNLCRQQRELIDFLIYRLASRMKSSTDMSDAFRSCREELRLALCSKENEAVY